MSFEQWLEPVAFQWWTHPRMPLRLCVIDRVLIGPAHHAMHHRHQPKRLGDQLRRAALRQRTGVWH